MNTPNEKGKANLTKKTMDIIEYLCSQPQSVSLNQVASGVKLPPATVYRILSTLKDAGYLNQRSNKDYYMTYRLYVMSGRMIENDPYVRRFLPFMNYCILNLNSYCGVSLTAFCENCCVNLISVGNDLKFRTKMAVNGAAHDCHCTAAGKLFLSCLSDSELNAFLSRNLLLPHTRHTVTDPDRLRADLQVIRDQGYATIDSEFAEGMAVVSIPLHSTDGQIDLAINFSIESDHFSEISNPGFVRSVLDLLDKYNIF